MKVYLPWLNDLVKIDDLPIDKLVALITKHATEVEAVERVVQCEKTIVGYVKTCAPHPDSDHLHLLTVDTGAEVLDIVCGAPNVAAGQYIILAQVGAKLPGGEIKKAKIRGAVSYGMVCSLQELGIENKFVSSEFAEGIYYFKEPKPLGMPAAEALGLDGVVLDLGITPNRSDLLSLIGVAYDLAAVLDRPLLLPAAKLTRQKSALVPEVNLATPDVTSYYAQVLEGVEIKPSPTWLQNRLIASGIRPINNCVDITNYVLVLFGQPLHAFDADRLGLKIGVRNAAAGETVRTLDEIERQLAPGDIVITDGRRPVCLGGVMGGFDTEITEQTRNIILEAAVFNGSAIRKTSSRLGLRSESSLRFERGIDLNRTQAAVDYACHLFATLAGAKVTTLVHAGKKSLPDKKIALTPKEVNSLLGTKLSKCQIRRILERLGFSYDGITAVVPNRRLDITIKEDLIEEVARLYSYDNIPTTYPAVIVSGGLTFAQQLRRSLRTRLINLGFHECATYHLVGQEELVRFGGDPARAIKVLTPLTEHHAYLRQSLIPSLIEVAVYNASRKQENFQLFELARTYQQHGAGVSEPEQLAGLMFGEFFPLAWSETKAPGDYFTLKGIVEQMLATLAITAEFLPCTELAELHPRRSAYLEAGGVRIGLIGELHPQYALEKGLAGAVVFSLDLSVLEKLAQREVKLAPVAKQNPIIRDLAFTVKRDIPAGKVLSVAQGAGVPELQSVELFDVYETAEFSQADKSLALRLYLATDVPLTEAEIQKKVGKIVAELSEKLAATLRI